MLWASKYLTRLIISLLIDTIKPLKLLKVTSLQHNVSKKYNIKNKKMYCFCNILKKISTTALCSIAMQNIQIFFGGPLIFVVI